MPHLTLYIFALNFHREGLAFISLLRSRQTLVKNIIFIKSQLAIKQTNTFQSSIPTLQCSSKGNNKGKYEKIKDCSLRGRDLIKRRP